MTGLAVNVYISGSQMVQYQLPISASTTEWVIDEEIVKKVGRQAVYLPIPPMDISAMASVHLRPHNLLPVTPNGRSLFHGRTAAKTQKNYRIQAKMKTQVASSRTQVTLLRNRIVSDFQSDPSAAIGAEWRKYGWKVLSNLSP